MEKVGLFTCTQPCSNCPYRTDAPLQLWHKSEYERLLSREGDELGATYKCHKKNGSVCVGWLMKQDEADFPSIALRIELMENNIDRVYLDKLNSPVPLYESVEAMIMANYPEVLNKRRNTMRKNNGRSK